jgi:hypothetical protein
MDSEGRAGTHSSLALACPNGSCQGDDPDQAHISYLDPDNHDLKHAWHDENGWHNERVPGAKGEYTSLALDSTGQPHIGYGHGHAVKYAWAEGAAWHIETVDGDVEGSDHASLVLDDSDQPYISYTTYDPFGTRPPVLKFAWRDGTTWQIETVDENAGGHSSLALDALGHPHISYQRADSQDLKYAWHDGVGWHTETVDSVGQTGYATSLAITCPSGQCQDVDSGNPHISYRNSTGLKFAWHDGTAWQIETVDSQGDIKGATSLALNEGGQPNISYRGDGCLKYASRVPTADADGRDGTGWRVEIVDDDGDVGAYASLALDSNGWPHISYFDKSNKDLKFAQLSPELDLHKEANPSDGLRNNEQLTYTLALSGPGLNVHLWDPLPTNVHYISGTLTSSVAPPAVYSPTVGAIVWEGVLPTDTVGTVRFQVTPGITGSGSLDLSSPIVNTAWLTDTDSGLGVSATSIVNGWHFYLPLILRQGQASLGIHHSLITNNPPSPRPNTSGK